MNLTITTAVLAEHEVITATGDLDWVNATLFGEAAEGVLTHAVSTPLVVDLTGVTFIDSTGLGMLVKALKTAQGHGRSLTLVTADDRAHQLLRITGLDAVFGIHDSLQTALSAEPPLSAF